MNHSPEVELGASHKSKWHLQREEAPWLAGFVKLHSKARDTAPYMSETSLVAVGSPCKWNLVSPFVSGLIHGIHFAQV